MAYIKKERRTNMTNPKIANGILVTGGAGFIGSHATLALARRGRPVVVLDNFSNAKPSTIATVEKMTGQSIVTIAGDIRDENLLAEIFAQHNITAVLHFAGLKAVAESMTDPLSYFSVNVGGSVSLLRAMNKNNIKKFIFSSSATVYGAPQQLPLTEDSPPCPHQPLRCQQIDGGANLNQPMRRRPNMARRHLALF